MHSDHRTVPDQAEVLRRLVEHHDALSSDRSTASPQRIVAVAGGKGGVGTTTLAVNLAVHWARQGWRTVLADFDLTSADVATLCGLEPHPTLLDVVHRGTRLSDALRPGPEGLRILAGPPTTGPAVSEISATAARQTIAMLRDPALDAQRVVIDAGHASSGQRWRWFHEIDHLLLVTTTDPVSLMDTYGAVKRLASEGPIRCALSYAINLVSAANEADDVHARFARSCWRFLTLEVPLAGSIPVDPAVVAAARARVPLLVQSPGSPAARAVARMSRRFVTSSQPPAVGAAPAAAGAA